MTHTVAVYGSLRAGLGNHRMLVNSHRLEDGWTAPDWRMQSLGGFPCIIPDEHGICIKVELYEVSDNTFARLDGLEGYPSFYDRREIAIAYSIVSSRSAWIYYMHECDRGDVVTSGDWKKYRSSNTNSYY